MNDTTSKERPILFSAPMVRAILDGHKRQTRRIVKPQPAARPFQIEGERSGDWFTGNRSYPDRGPMMDGRWRCPYGAPGDRLWVRETWASPEVDKTKPGRVAYDADGVCGCWIGTGEDRHFVCHGRVLQASGFHSCFPKEGATTRGLGDYSDKRSGEYPTYRHGWRPSIHMPRWASRITLEITGVRVERLQDISEADSDAEGADTPAVANIIGACWSKRDCFGKLWHTIHSSDGPNGWSSNPWVWVVEFRRMEPTV